MVTFLGKRCSTGYPYVSVICFFYYFNSFTLCEDRTLFLIVPAFDNCFISLFRVEYQLKSFKWMKEL